VGPNGAGKSTLLALLLGFLHPTAGTITIAGQDPRGYVRRQGAAYLPERFRLPPEWSVLAALRALAGLEGLPAGAARGRVDALLDRFELGPHAGKSLGTLSRGLLQRVGLAQALLAERALVVLDEPTEGLDPLWRIRFRALVEELKRAGRTILMASHDLGEVERLADRALLLDAGRVREIMEVGPRGDATTYRLELASEMPSLGDVFPGAVAADPGRPVYLVTAADPAELSRRLAALIDTGGIVAAVAPAGQALEERVRRALGERP
jgi:ABC-type multidrug transport system ATPase subunit